MEKQIEITHSEKIEDKRDTYYVYYPNQKHLGDIVKKKEIIEPKPYVKMGTWENVLLMPTKKYQEDPQHWIELVKKYREASDSRKWLKAE